MVDKGIKNVWKAAWLEERLEDGTTVGDVFLKKDEPGVATCCVCSKNINYGGEGLKALRRHCASKVHSGKLKIRKENYLLPGKLSKLKNTNYYR